MGSNAKVLVPEDVLDIYERAHRGESQSVIARDYAISQSTVSGIKRGYHWNDVTGHEKTRFTERQVRTLKIYSAYWDSKLPVREIAEQFGVPTSAVYDIRSGRVGARVTRHPVRKAA